MVSKTTNREYSAVSYLKSRLTRDGGERCARLGALGISDFVGDEVADTFNAVSQVAQRTGIDKVGVKDAVACFHFRADGINRMPCIIANRKGIASVG